MRFIAFFVLSGFKLTTNNLIKVYMSPTIETILLYTIAAGLLSIVYGYFTGKNILNSSAGNASADIASAIQIGAKHI